MTRAPDLGPVWWREQKALAGRVRCRWSLWTMEQRAIERQGQMRVRTREIEDYRCIGRQLVVCDWLTAVDSIAGS